MNTWFQKKRVQYGTWMHPATKQLQPHIITRELTASHTSPPCFQAEVALPSRRMPTPSFLLASSPSFGSGLPEWRKVKPSANVDRKLDLVVREIKRYGISVAGIQESRWFGSDVWPAADGFTFLHSGRPLPKDGEDARRNEGVGILLDGRATSAWKQGGEVWEAVSSRVIMVRLKLLSKGMKQEKTSYSFVQSIILQ